MEGSPRGRGASSLAPRARRSREGAQAKVAPEDAIPLRCRPGCRRCFPGRRCFPAALFELWQEAGDRIHALNNPPAEIRTQAGTNQSSPALNRKPCLIPAWSYSPTISPRGLIPRAIVKLAPGKSIDVNSSSPNRKPCVIPALM